jgi:uncharacterized protein (TIGR03118 family)
MQRRHLLIASGSAALLAACGGGDDDDDTPRNRFTQVNLVASDADSATFDPELADADQDAEFINGWGIAIRPAGAGGHFWVTAGGWSFEFVGDVTASADVSLRSLFQDALTLVRLPGAGVPDGEPDVTNTDNFIGFGTGVVFNGAPLESDLFAVANQQVEVGGVTQTLSGSARFIFATDSGVISGWTERDATSGAVVRRNGPAVQTVDNNAAGHAYFGLAIKPGTWDRLWVADFGAAPQVRAFDAQWQPVALGSAFANPFIGSQPAAVPGDYVPFNIQVLEAGGTPYVFVAYAKSQPDPNDPTQFFAAEEDAIAAADETTRPNRGRVAMFDLDGALVRAFSDDARLNAPWGLAVAPSEGFGPFNGALLVGNFGGAGRIAAYDIARGSFIDFVRDASGEPVAVEGLWGLQFGNGASLGDSNALYFAAGPGDETQGLFGALRHDGG